MDAFGVVVMDVEGDGFVEFGRILILKGFAQLQLELAEETLDEAVLPGAALIGAAQADLQLLAELAVPVR